MKLNSVKNLKLLSVIFGIIGTFMIFFPALAFPNSDSSFSGFKIAFGTEFVNLGEIANGRILFNVFAILAYFLPVSAALVLLFAKKRSDMISTILFGVSVLLLLLMPTYTVVTVTVLGNTNRVDIEWVFSFGLIIAIVCSIGGLVIGTFSAFPKSAKIL